MKWNKSSNPSLTDKVFSRFEGVSSQGQMTVNGTMNKTAMLLGIAVLSAAFVWSKFFAAFVPGVESAAAASVVTPWILVGAIGGFIVALITTFKPNLAKITAPIYAALEGLFLGGASAYAEASYGGGIVMNSVALTMGVFVLMLFLYRTEKIRVTGKFRLAIIAATGGIALVYLGSFVLGFFGINVPFLHGNGMISIIISLVIVVIAALNLMLDFDFIDRAAAGGAPKDMEWYGAFGLMVTLVWLYIEILRLLSKITSRN